MNYPILFVLFTFLFLLPLGAGQPDYYELTVGNGILSGEQSTSISGKITEIHDYSPYWFPQQWVFEQDSRFPTGVFIYCEAFPDLVWDSSGGKTNAGNPIILYQRKNTSEATKNQRWIITPDNQFALVANPNMVARVNSSAPNQLSLAPKNSSDPKQKFIQIPPQDSSIITIFNYLPYDLEFTVVSIIGNWNGTILGTPINPDDPVNEIRMWFPAGTWIRVFDTGVLLLNITVQDYDDTYLVARTDLPLGTHQWVGWSQPNDNNENDASITFTWTSNPDEGPGGGDLTGYGTDILGAFTIENGAYYAGGEIDFQKQYESFSYWCTGTLDITATIESGDCENGPAFQYTLVN